MTISACPVFPYGFRCRPIGRGPNMRAARGPQSKQEWDLTNSEWSVNAKAEIVVWRQHWSASQTPEQKVPEVILRDVTRLGTLMRPRGNSYTTVRAFGTACPLTWNQPPAPQAQLSSLSGSVCPPLPSFYTPRASRGAALGPAAGCLIRSKMRD